MDSTVEQGALHRALRQVGRAVPTRAALPILEHAVIAAAPGTVTLTATDLEIGMIVTITADVSAPGRVVVPARLLGDYVAQLPSAPVRLSMDPARPRLHARCGRFTAGFATADPEEFPAIPEAGEASELALNARTLQEATERVAFAAARDETRPVLATMLIAAGSDGLTFAACDGFRLARARVPVQTPAPQEVLVPTRAAAEFGRLLGEAETVRLRLSAGGRTLHLHVGDTVLFARLAEGRFPDIERVIPGECRTLVSVETAALRRAVGVCALFGASAAGRPVRIDAVAGRLRLRAQGDETGDAQADVPAELRGEPQVAALSTPLLADILAVATGKELELGLSGPQSPVVIREIGRSDEADVWLLMPLHDLALASSQVPGGPEAPPPAAPVPPAAPGPVWPAQPPEEPKVA